MYSISMRNKKGQFIKGSKVGKPFWFRPGNIPHNKGQRGIRVSPETEFKKGVHSMHFKGYGKPNVIHRSGRRIEVIATTPEQVPSESRGRKYMTRKRTTYARYLWKEHYGEIPKGMIVYNKDQDHPEDIRVENLCLITRAELIKLNTGGKL